MISFDKWFSRAVPEVTSEPTSASFALEDELDQTKNLRMLADGSFEAKCCRCERWGELYVDIDEVRPFEGYEHYCGGSPWCCP